MGNEQKGRFISKAIAYFLWLLFSVIFITIGVFLYNWVEVNSHPNYAKGYYVFIALVFYFIGKASPFIAVGISIGGLLALKDPKKNN